MNRRLEVGGSRTSTGPAPTPHRWAWLEPKTSETHRAIPRTASQQSYAPKPALRRAQAALAQVSTAVLGEEGIGPEIQGQVLRFLQRVTKSDSLLGSVAPDEGGTASLHWVAGKKILHIEIGEAGPCYLWSRNELGDTRRVTDPKPIYNLAESMLGRMSADVVRAREARLVPGKYDGES